MMTAAHRRKMMAGRQRAAERQRREHIAAMDAYRVWVRRDAEAWAQLHRMREMFGHASPEAIDARSAALESLRSMPPMSTLPSDSTWRELSGDVRPRR